MQSSREMNAVAGYSTSTPQCFLIFSFQFYELIIFFRAPVVLWGEQIGGRSRLGVMSNQIFGQTSAIV